MTGSLLISCLLLLLKAPKRPAKKLELSCTGALKNKHYRAKGPLNPKP